MSFGKTTHPHVAFRNHMAAAYTPRCWITSPVGILFLSNNDSQQASEGPSFLGMEYCEDSAAHARGKSPDCSHPSPRPHCKRGSEMPSQEMLALSCSEETDDKQHAGQPLITGSVPPPRASGKKQPKPLHPQPSSVTQSQEHSRGVSESSRAGIT